jgi:predicted P-loop ATPase
MPPPLELFKGGSETIQLAGLDKTLAGACRVLRRKDLCELLIGSNDIEFNLMGNSPEAGRKPIQESDMIAFRERSENTLRGVMGGKAKKIVFAKDTIQDAILRVASERPYHPVREYLSGLAPFQPGEPGIGNVGDILALPESGLSRTILRRWAVGAVRRAMKPGCQHKNVLILVGAQDAGKSKLFKILASDAWFADSDMDLRNKDSYQQLQTAWIYEWSELSSIRTSNEERTKAFISSARDTYRAPFARMVESHPRSTIIVGTSNRDDVLFDPTGSVRLWPMRVPDVMDLDGLEQARDSFWAEAFSAYQIDEPHWLTLESQRADLVQQQKEFTQEDPWTERIMDWLNPDGKSRVGVITTRLAAEGALRLQPSEMNSGTDRRVAEAMKRAGWDREKYANTKLGDPRWGQRVRAWHPVECVCEGGTHVCGKSNGAQ